MENLTFYTGLQNKDIWEKTWKNKNLKQGKLTNVSLEYGEAAEFSWDEDISVVKISNVPYEAIYAYRKNDYENDDDIVILNNINEKQIALNNHFMFLLDLHNYKNIIKTELV